MINNALQNIIFMTLKQGDMVVPHIANIYIIYYKLWLNMYSYTNLVLISDVNPCG